MQVSFFDGNEDFHFNKPIRLIEFFAGYGSQALALKELGVKFEHWRICEWAIKSIQAYKDNHFSDDTKDYSQHLTSDYIFNVLAEWGISQNYNEPLTLEQIKRLGEKECRKIYNNILATHNLVNISRVKGKDLQIEDTDKYDYVLTYSFPCFTADSLVLTRNGHKRICDVDYGDFVLSHDNKYHKVVNIFNNGTHDIYKINAMGVDEIKTTLNHKFYVREMFHKGHKGTRCFKQPIWKELRELTKNDYLGIAVNQENRAIVSNKLPMQNEHFWWIIGRYLGDGWIRKQQGIIICCDKAELEEITYHLDKLDWHYNIAEERTVLKIHIPKKALSDFVSQFGNGAGNKHLTQDILDLPIHYLTPFIKGYMSADGCFTNGLYKATSISRELIYGIAQCVAKVYKTPYRIYKVEPPKTKIIENRLVNQNSWYQLVFKTEKKKQDKAFYEDGYIWYPIKSIEYIGKNNVYDIEVEDSHSFTVQNTIVHNCQDLSKAGKGMGMAKDSGTRSGLLWEVERILDECAELGNLPKVLLMENVPDVIGSKNLPHFRDWRDKLESMGYKCYWQVLNSKDYGIPQNRERCFMISILGDYFYAFPREIKLPSKLIDILETQVDEKFYLSQKGLIYAFDCNRVCDNTKRGDLGDRKVNPSVAKTISCRGAESQRADVTNFVVGDNSVEYTLGEIRDKINKFRDIKEPIACELRYDEGIRTFKDNIMGTLRTIDGCGDKHIIEPTLKEQLCDRLVESGLLKVGTVINHSYTNGLNGKNPNSRQTLEDYIENEDGICNTLTTRPDVLGVAVEDLTTKNKRLASMVDKIDPTKCQAIDIYNQSVHDEMHTIKTNVDRANMTAVTQNLRIRKLTPKECFRLMAVRDENFEMIAKNQSNASLYHLAGDSIVVAVLVAILGQFVNGFDFDQYVQEFYKQIKENENGN